MYEYIVCTRGIQALQISDMRGETLQSMDIRTTTPIATYIMDGADIDNMISAWYLVSFLFF